MVPTYLTSTLEATILSPSDMCKALSCKGYSNVSNLDGRNCHLELVHCQRRSQNIRFDLEHRGGLLYTGILVAPNKADRTSKKPKYILHADLVTSDQTVPTLDSHDASIASCLCVDCKPRSFLLE